MMSPARLDLATEWRSRRWRRLLNLIDRLPRNSLFFEAISNDERLADQLAASAGDDKPAKPTRRMADWSPTVEILTSILNRLGELTQAVAALGGAKPRKVQHAPYPVTAIEAARRRRREARHRMLVSRVLPKRSDTPST